MIIMIYLLYVYQYNQLYIYIDNLLSIYFNNLLSIYYYIMNYLSNLIICYLFMFIISYLSIRMVALISQMPAKTRGVIHTIMITFIFNKTIIVYYFLKQKSTWNRIIYCSEFFLSINPIKLLLFSKGKFKREVGKENH